MTEIQIAFEEWHRTNRNVDSKFLEAREGENYVDSCTHYMWLAYQAGHEKKEK